MGSALARAFVNARRSVTVWNRSGAKAHVLVQLGAAAANSVSAAVTASPVVLICIDSYQTTQALFYAGVAHGAVDDRCELPIAISRPVDDLP